MIITNDTDFGELFFLQKKVSSGIILFRLEGQETTEKITLLGSIIHKYADKIGKHFIVVTRKRIRIVPLGEI